MAETSTRSDGGGGRDVECHACGYEWEYSGDLDAATCPNCRTKTIVDDDPEDEAQN